MPVDRHRTIIAIIGIAFGLFLLEDVTGWEFSAGYRAVPLDVENAWSGLLAGDTVLESVHTLLTLVTAVFLHGGVEHVLYNMVFLWAFGSLTSQHLGQWWALLFFFVTGACGNIAHVLLNSGSPIPLLGASGAVSGFEGVYLGLALRWSLHWPDVWPLAHPVPPSQLCIFAVVGFLFDVFGLMNGYPGVAFGAHIGGFLSGLAIAGLITTTHPTPDAWQRRWSLR
jgi:membrane associated rhomboid family serine protease